MRVLKWSFLAFVVGWPSFSFFGAVFYGEPALMIFLLVGLAGPALLLSLPLGALGAFLTRWTRTPDSGAIFGSGLGTLLMSLTSLWSRAAGGTWANPSREIIEDQELVPYHPTGLLPMVIIVGVFWGTIAGGWSNVTSAENPKPPRRYELAIPTAGAAVCFGLAFLVHYLIWNATPLYTSRSMF